MRRHQSVSEVRTEARTGSSRRASARSDKGAQRTSRTIRLAVLGVGLAIITAIGIAHQNGVPVVGVDALCPFGGIETLWSLITSATLDPAHRGVERDPARRRARDRAGLPPRVLRLHLPARRDPGVRGQARAEALPRQAAPGPGGARPSRAVSEVRGARSSSRSGAGRRPRSSSGRTTRGSRGCT